MALPRPVLCLAVALMVAAPVAAEDLVANADFASGGHTYADHWRPLPGPFRMLRQPRPDGDHSLYLQLRDDGDGGVMQIVELPPNRALSLRMLATCWADGNDCVIAGLVRIADGVVLAEVTVDGIERGELSANFDSGPGGPAELMLRVVGDRGARASIDHVTIGPPAEAGIGDLPIFSSDSDLALAPGDGLRVDADFTPRLLPAAAEMLQEAIEDATGQPARRVAAAVEVSVAQPEATDWPARESYHLTVGPDGVTIEAPAEQGAFWGMMTLLDLIRPEPDGGARILAVDVTDQPALPWRIAIDQDLIVAKNAMNAARRLARLKLNMGLVASGAPGAEGAMATMREHGVEPVAFVPHYPGSEDVPSELRDAVERLGARHLLLSYWYGGVLDWEAEPLATALALARDGAAEVIVLLEEISPTGPAPGQWHEEVSQVVPDWPSEVVFAMPWGRPSEAQAELIQSLAARGISWIADLSGGRAEGDLLAQPGCVGAIAVGNLERAADLAWRGLAEDMR